MVVDLPDKARVVTSLTALAVPSFPPASDLKVEAGAGKVAVPSQPEWVVAFNLAAIDDLDALGVDLAGVPEITPPAQCEAAMAGVEGVGTLFEPDCRQPAVTEHAPPKVPRNFDADAAAAGPCALLSGKSRGPCCFESYETRPLISIETRRIVAPTNISMLGRT